MYFGFAKQIEKNRNRLSYGLFQFQFFSFEDTLVAMWPISTAFLIL